MLCGMAQSLVQIMLFRILQGYSAALVPFANYSVQYQFERRRQGSNVVWGVAVMAGPVLAQAWRLSDLGLQLARAVFYINLPISIFAFFGISASEPTHGTLRRSWTGLALARSTCDQPSRSCWIAANNSIGLAR